MKKILIADYSLKKMGEDRNPLLFREKNAIAVSIANYGADIIELEGVKKVKEDTIIYQTISKNIKGSAIALPAGTTTDEIDVAWECIKDAEKPILQIALPVSTVQMEYIYHAKDVKMLPKIVELCKYAATKCKDVEFVALDATRADRDFLIKVCAEAAAAGATAITICDDAGTIMPEDIADLIANVKSCCKATIFVKLSNGVNMATASALAAIGAGADGVKCAISGFDSIETHKFAQTIRLLGEKLGICTDLKETEIATDVKKLQKAIDATKTTGAILNDNDIILDATSTLTEVVDAAKSLGYDLSIEDNGKIFESLKVVCEKKNSVGAKELEAIIASTAMQVPSTYHLDNFVTNCGNQSLSMTQIVLIKGDERLYGVSTGDGPVDSAFKAIDQAIGFHYDLDDFQIQSVTQGKEALGSAIVKLSKNGKIYSGTGLSSDIVGASIRAYVNALNKIVYEEMQ